MARTAADILGMPRIVMIVAVALFAGCEPFGSESAEKVAAAREADGKAIGGACRHAGRAIEDCYTLNKRADKPAVFAGWREMNDYMREFKLEALAPQIVAQTAVAVGSAAPAAVPGASAPAMASLRPAKPAAAGPAASAAPAAHAPSATPAAAKDSKRAD